MTQRAKLRTVSPWSRLHRTTDYTETSFGTWLRTVPTGCGCRDDLPRIVAESQIDFSSLAAFRESGWRLHNLVNVKLGKPTITLARAKELYGWT